MVRMVLSCLPHLCCSGKFFKKKFFSSPPGESLVDFSQYHPGGSLSDNAFAVSASGFTFPDGKDDGSSLPTALRHDVDLAEVSQSLRDLDKKASDEVKTQLKRQAELAEINRIDGEFANFVKQQNNAEKSTSLST